MPLFFGANPAEVRIGPTSGQRTLPEEEDLARGRWCAALPSEQKQVAVVSATAFPDILTDKNRVAYAFCAAARAWRTRSMGGEQRTRLVGLIRHYVRRTNDELSAFTWGKIERAGSERDVRLGGRRRARPGALLRDQGPDVPDRVRQHAERGQPHPLGAART